MTERPEAAERMASRLALLRALLVREGCLILADCARSNFWADLGLVSPFARTIDWRRHQDPEAWIAVLRRVGLRFRDLRWSGMYPAELVTANRGVQYLTRSHFVLRMNG